MKISFIMQASKLRADYLKEAISSIQKQTNKSWELIIYNSNSEDSECLKILKSFENHSQIKIINSTESLGPSEAYNLAASATTGSYLVLFNPIDILPEFSVERIISSITESNFPDFLYSDEDIIDKNGNHVGSDLKPNFSLELLRSMMYMSDFLIIKKNLFENLKGFRSDYDGAHNYDLALRISTISKSITHIPEILNFRRVVDDPAELIYQQYNFEEKGIIALNDNLSKSSKVRSYAEKGFLPCTFRARFPLNNNQRVTLIIITAGYSRNLKGKGDVVLINNFVKSIIAKSNFKNFDILVMNSGFLDSDTRNLISSVNGKVIELKFEGCFNFSKAVNSSLPHVKNEFIVFLNDDLEVISKDWIESLIELLQDNQVGAVGGMLFFEDNTIQHCGMSIYSSEPFTKHIFYKTDPNEAHVFLHINLIRNYSCVTGAVLATRKSTMKTLGGFDEKFPIDYNDVDFCFRLIQSGLRVVFTPYCKLYHYDNSSFKRKDFDFDAWKIFHNKWNKFLISDKFFNKNIDKRSDKYFIDKVKK